MNHSGFYSRLAALIVCLVVSGKSNCSFAQLVRGDAFLKGKYIEVGIAPNGVYGSVGDAPVGYHPRSGGFTASNLGFVADPDQDGWTAGTPAYFGDYFVPGDPFEGWDVQINGSRYKAWNTGTSSGTYSSTSMSGSNISYSATGSSKISVWSGAIGNLKIIQRTIVDTLNLYFITEVFLKNTGTIPLNNIYYNRAVDPDNEATLTSDYSTKNIIVAKPLGSDIKALVSATGPHYPRCYLGLGTKDCRAKAYITKGFYTDLDSVNMADLFNETATQYKYAVGDSDISDNVIGLVFNVGNLAAGDSTVVKYAYILKEQYLDSAFNVLHPTWSSNGIVYQNNDTILGCRGGNVNVSIINGSNYTWGIWSPSTGLSNPSGSNNTITVGSVPVTYRVIGTSIICSSSDTLNITIAPVPAPKVISPVNLCLGSTPAALTATGVNLKWYTKDTGGTGSAFITPGTALTGTTTFYVSQTINGCEGPRAPITVIVNSLPAAPVISSPVSLCIGLPAAALSATGTALKWYTTASGGTGSTTPFTPPTTVVGSTSYYVSQTLGGCESPRATIIVNVNALPSPPVVTSPLKLCIGATAAPLTATGSSLRWYRTASGDTGSSVAIIPGSTTTGSTSYYVSQTVNGCESPRTEIIVTVNALPPAPSVFSPVILCSGTIATLLAATGSDLRWYTAATGGVPLPAAPVPITTKVDTSSYWVSQTLSTTGCESPRAEIRVIISATPAPPVPLVSTPLNYCVGDPTTVLAALKGSSTDTLIWYTTLAGIPSITAPTPNSAIPSSTDYYVNLRTSAGCDGTKALIKVNINPRPAAPAVITPAKLCNGTTTETLSATGTNLKWYTADTGGTGSSTAPSFSTTVIGSWLAYVSQTTALGCEGPRAKITVLVQPTPKVLILAPGIPDFVFCDGKTVLLKAISPTGIHYQWQTSGTVIPGATFDTFSTGIKGYYAVTVENSYGCKATDSVLVKPNTLPAPTLSPIDIQICEGVNIMLYAKPSNTNYIYEWMMDSRFIPVSVDQSNTPVNQSGAYAVKITDIYNCVKITNESNVSTYPTVFKPSIIRLDPVLRLNRPYARYQWYRNNKPIAGATAATYKLLFDGNYFAEVSDVNSCYNYSDTITVNALGIKENAYNADLKVYPNPTQNIVNIEASIPVTVRVTDIVGKVIFEKSGVHTVDLNQYADGTYFFQISDNSNNVIRVEKINKISFR